MAEMGAEARNTLQSLALLPHKDKLLRKVSLKRRREEESKLLLTAQNIKHGEKCNRCSLNCQVKHDESMNFWARVDGLEPQYTLGNCPKQGKLEKARIKIKKHKR